MHPRFPALGPGTQALLWAVGLGLFIWMGLLAVGSSGATAFLFGLIAGGLIFFFVRLCGDDRLRR